MEITGDFAQRLLATLGVGSAYACIFMYVGNAFLGFAIRLCGGYGAHIPQHAIKNYCLYVETVLIQSSSLEAHLKLVTKEGERERERCVDGCEFQTCFMVRAKRLHHLLAQHSLCRNVGKLIGRIKNWQREGLLTFDFESDTKPK